MPEAIVADASCLIVLSNIGELSLLRGLYTRVIITPTIAGEFGETLPEWITIRSPSSHSIDQIRPFDLDAGESSAIALALELANSRLVLDDYKARKVAAQLRLKFTGTVGILIKAKNSGLIPSLRPWLGKMESAGFRISPLLISKALKEAGE